MERGMPIPPNLQVLHHCPASAVVRMYVGPYDLCVKGAGEVLVSGIALELDSGRSVEEDVFRNEDPMVRLLMLALPREH